MPLAQAIVLDAAVRLLDEVVLDAIADRIVADAACAPLPSYVNGFTVEELVQP